MAEINIKRKSTPAWAWLLALIIIVAGAFLVYNLVRDDRAATTNPETVQTNPQTQSTY